MLSRKVFTLLFILLPFLDIYSVGIQSVSLGKFFLLLVALYLFIRNKLNLPLYKDRLFQCFLLFLCVGSLVANIGYQWFSMNEYVHKLVAVGGFYLTIGFALKYILWDRFSIYYRNALLVCSLFFLLQFVLFNTIGFRLLGIIPSLPLTVDVAVDSLLEKQLNIDRFCSFFMEPAHFAYYIIPYYTLVAFRNKAPFRSKEFLFFTLILFMLRSGNGFFAMAVVFTVIFGRMLLSKRNIVRNFILVCLASAIGYVLYNQITSSTEFQEQVVRASEMSSRQENKRLSSGYQRIYAGYVYIAEMDNIHEVTGIGLGNQNAYFRTHSMSEFRSVITNPNTKYVYLNSIQLIIVWAGFGTLILFLLYNYKLFSRNSLTGKTLSVILLLSYFISSNLFGISMLFMLTLIIRAKQQHLQKKTIAGVAYE